jgi:hypothetical protein
MSFTGSERENRERTERLHYIDYLRDLLNNRTISDDERERTRAAIANELHHLQRYEDLRDYYRANRDIPLNDTASFLSENTSNTKVSNVSGVSNAATRTSAISYRQIQLAEYVNQAGPVHVRRGAVTKVTKKKKKIRAVAKKLEPQLGKYKKSEPKVIRPRRARTVPTPARARPQVARINTNLPASANRGRPPALSRRRMTDPMNDRIPQRRQPRR